MVQTHTHIKYLLHLVRCCRELVTSKAKVPEEEMEEGVTPALNFLDLVVMHVTSALVYRLELVT